jgi:23S rRNA (adenine2503-C2)-methyltransferase
MINSLDKLTVDLATASNINVAGMNAQALDTFIKTLGESSYRASQIYDGLYRQRWTRWEQFSNLPKALRIRLEMSTNLHWPSLFASIGSCDGSVKHTFFLDDGSLVEGVYMPYGDRATICLSSQVGCAMGCAFCATGSMGIKRNLSVTELIGQVVVMLNANGHNNKIPINLVFMGMGEPMHNLDNIMYAFAILTDKKGLAITPKRVNLSTVGLVSGIQRLGTYINRPRLAISLNATTDKCRSMLMPVNRTWNLANLMVALKGFPLGRNEYITIEYVLLKGITDSIDDGQRLASFANQFPSKVNLIPFNPYKDSQFEPPSETRIEALCSILASRGVVANVRRSRGQDVAGACGQMVRNIKINV